jgi:hypothetical protein
MDFWPEEIERPDDEDDFGFVESGAGESGQESGFVESVEFRTAGSAESGSVEFPRGDSGNAGPPTPQWPDD